MSTVPTFTVITCDLSTDLVITRLHILGRLMVNHINGVSGVVCDDLRLIAAREENDKWT